MEMNCGPLDQLPPATTLLCFLNLYWDRSMDVFAPGGHLDPALSSMVSSPASNSTVAVASEGLALHGILSQPHYGGTPLSSPPKLNISMMGQFHHYPPPQVGDAGAGGQSTPENLMHMGSPWTSSSPIAECVARLSGFDAHGSRGGYTGGGASGQFDLQDNDPASALKELELGNARDELSVSDLVSASAETALNGAFDGNARKRKAGEKGKGKEGPTASHGEGGETRRRRRDGEKEYLRLTGGAHVHLSMDFT